MSTVPNNVYFKFMTCSDLSKKRLLYNELYFASREEINDPYDINADKTLKGSESDFGKLFGYIMTFVMKEVGQPVFSQSGPFVAYLMANPISKNNLELLNTQDFAMILLKCFPVVETSEAIKYAKVFHRHLLELFNTYLPDNAYIVSFSKQHGNTLMWSHYADQHKGFCLVFSAINNTLYQDSRYVVKSIKLSPNISSSVPRAFPFEKVSYEPRLVELDAFLSLPGVLAARHLTEEEHKAYWEKYRTAFTRKSEEWKYEEEYRLVLPSYAPIENKLHRLFRFDITQLTGIILGSKIKDSDIRDLQDIVYGIRTRLSENGRFPLPVFTFYRSVMDYSNLTIQSSPFQCLDMYNKWRLITNPTELQHMRDHYYRVMKTGNIPDTKGVYASFDGEIEYF